MQTVLDARKQSSQQRAKTNPVAFFTTSGAKNSSNVRCGTPPLLRFGGMLSLQSMKRKRMENNTRKSKNVREIDAESKRETSDGRINGI
jgi:hypothetical protein